MFKFSQKSSDKLNTVKPILKEIAEEVLKRSQIDFGITCGIRTYEEQRQLYYEGKSKTLASKHLTGDAIDILCYVDNKPVWNDLTPYKFVVDIFKEVAKEKNVKIRFGLEFKTFVDVFHIELS